MKLPEEHISLTELMQCPEFSELPEEVAQKMLDSVREFCSILASDSLNGLDLESLENETH